MFERIKNFLKGFVVEEKPQVTVTITVHDYTEESLKEGHDLTLRLINGEYAEAVVLGEGFKVGELFATTLSGNVYHFAIEEVHQLSNSLFQLNMYTVESED